MKYFLAHKDLNQLLRCLTLQGYHCMGPQVKNGAIVFDTLSNTDQLPWGIQEQQQPGKYQLNKTELNRAFAWSNGPEAIKPLTFKPKESLWTVERDADGKLNFKPSEPKTKPVAILGARACDLAGLAVQDRVFLEGEYVDKHYKAHRDNLFIIAVNCGYSAGNCFCVSTNTGPKANAGFDLVLTEIDTGFVLESGSERGNRIVEQLTCEPAKEENRQAAHAETKRAVKMQTKAMPLKNSQQLNAILKENLDHPRWEEVAERCLSCGNCTMVCPTCFCHHETETPDLSGHNSNHAREWDSCFSAGHSYIHGKVIRDDTKSRYKQWLTHKLGSWWEQFDESGCIGCGRCVTWCPVGIDITEEMAAISGKTNVVDSEEEDK